MTYRIEVTGETWQDIVSQVANLSSRFSTTDEDAAPLRGSRGKFAGSTPGARKPRKERTRNYSNPAGVESEPVNEAALPTFESPFDTGKQEPPVSPAPEPEPLPEPEPVAGMMLAELLEYARAYQKKHGDKKLRALLQDFGVIRVSNLTPDKYSAFGDALTTGEEPVPSAEELLS